MSFVSLIFVVVYFFKQKTAYEMRISDWSSDVCSSDLPVDAWTSIVEDGVKSKHYKSIRGMGGFVRSGWDEVNEIIAAANVYTIRKYGPEIGRASCRERVCQYV